MSSNLNYETYIFFNSEKIILSVYDDMDKKVYEEDLKIKIIDNHDIFEKIDFFLSKSIFKAERKLKNFIKETSIIIDLDIFFLFEISIKNNYENKINLENIKRLLYEAKAYCRKTLDNKEIIHIIITNYKVDNKNFSSLPLETKCNNFSLDIKFITISSDYLKNLEVILKKYHISLKKLVKGNYVKSFLTEDEKDLFLLTKKIANGFNPNEVVLVKKIEKKHGFFERFFHFFN